MPFLISSYYLLVVSFFLKVQESIVLFMPFRFLEPFTKSLLNHSAFFSQITFTPPE